MLKKILTLCLALIMLSSLALAYPDAIDAQAAYAQLSVGDNTAAITDEVLGGDVELILEAEEATNAIVISAVYVDEQFVTAAVSEEKSIVEGDNELTVLLPTAQVGDSCEVKFFVWEKSTLAPLAQPVAIEVTPQQSVTAEYTQYSSADGTAETEGRVYYEWLYPAFGTFDNELAVASAKDTCMIGRNKKSSGNYYAPFLRFPLPVLTDGEEVTSAKIVVTVSENAISTTNFTVNAYGYSPDGKAFGEMFSKNSFDTLTNIIATGSVGNTPVAKDATVVGSTIEIDVTDYVKSCTGSADFFLAEPNIGGNTAKNYVAIYSPISETATNRPQLVITTEK